MQTDKDGLIQEIGALVASDPRVNDKDWQGVSVVVSLFDEGSAMHAYRYGPDGSFQPRNPRGNKDEIRERLRNLRRIMAAEAGAEWHQCLIQIWKPGPKIHIDFEYDDPQRWKPRITGLDMSEYANSIRPPMGGATDGT